MEKKNTNTDSLAKLLQKRWSPRQFDDQQISKKTIFQIFDAGKTSMSCFNEQPWRVILASKDDPHYNKLFECLTPGNQQWVQTAPFLGVVLVKKHFSKKDKENRHRFYDSGAFMAFSTLKAVSLGLFIHQMAGFSVEKVHQNFPIPDEFEAITCFVIGHAANLNTLPKEQREQEQKRSPRKPVNHFLFGDQWDESYLDASNISSD